MCLPSGTTGNVSWYSIEANLGKIGVVGVTVMVSFNHSNKRLFFPDLELFSHRISPSSISCEVILFLMMTDVSDSDVREAELRLSRNIDQILLLKRRLLNEPKSTSWFFSGNNATSNQLESLETLNHQLYMDLDSLVSDSIKSRDAKSLYGKIRNILGYILTVYSIYKILSTSINLLLGRSGKGLDPVTHAINIGGHWLGIIHGDELETWGRNISFIVIGVLVFVSIRGLLLLFLKVRSPL
jgi:hypothetical protein